MGERLRVHASANVRASAISASGSWTAWTRLLCAVWQRVRDCEPVAHEDPEAAARGSVSPRFARTIAVALPALTVGAGIGLARLEREGASFDAIMGLTFLTWVVYATFLVLRWEAGWRGRRTAYLAVAGFLLVVLVRIVLTPFVHF